MATLLGPCCRTQIPSIGLFTVGDLFLIILAAIYLPQWLQSRLYLGPYRTYSEFAAILFIFSVIGCPDHSAELSGILNVLQIALIYFITLSAIKSDDEARNFILAFGYAALVASVMQIYSYSHGTSLLLTEFTDEDMNRAILGDIDSPFVKTAFFYGNTVILFTAAAVIGIYSIILFRTRTLLERLFWMPVTVCAIIAGSLSSRTTLVVVGISACFMLCVLFRRTYRVVRSRRLLYLVLALIATCSVLWKTYGELLAPGQREGYEKMYMEGAEGSLGERILIWKEATEKMGEFPKALLIGMGPNVILHPSGTSAAEVHSLMHSHTFSEYGGSFHNLFLDYIFHLGAISFLIAMIVTFSTMRRLFRGITSSVHFNEVPWSCFLVIGSFLVTGVTLGLAWGKPYLPIAQFFAVAHLVIDGRLGH